MSLKEQVYSVLLVSASGSFNSAASEMLPPSHFQPVTFASSVSEAKRSLASRAYDFVIVNSPLPDESVTRFAIDCCHSPSTVVLILARADIYSEVRDRVGEHGVFTLSKPTPKLIMHQSLDWMASFRERLRRMQAKTLSMEERMEEIRVVNRAKLLLIGELKMTEADAHHFIERTAMDNCITKKQAAENIIKIYS